MLKKRKKMKEKKTKTEKPTKIKKSHLVNYYSIILADIKFFSIIFLFL